MVSLHNYLATLHRFMRSFDSDAQLRHRIAPILIFVSNLFGPNTITQLIVGEDVKGDNVKANAHFEFMLKRNNKRICIVQAKKGDMDAGVVQDLVGMEVVADVYGLDTVYGTCQQN